MIAEVDDDNDGQMNFREFLLIFSRAKNGTLKCEGLSFIAKTIDVSAEGVSGAKGFFDKLAANQSQTNKFEQEIKDEQSEKKKTAEEAKVKKAAFAAKIAAAQGK